MNYLSLIFSTIYIFIPASDCVGSDPSTLRCLGTCNAVNRVRMFNATFNNILVIS